MSSGPLPSQWYASFHNLNDGTSMQDPYYIAYFMTSECSKKNSGAHNISSGEHPGPMDCYCPQKVYFAQPKTAFVISYATFSTFSHMSNFDF